MHERCKVSLLTTTRLWRGSSCDIYAKKNISGTSLSFMIKSKHKLEWSCFEETYWKRSIDFRYKSGGHRDMSVCKLCTIEGSDDFTTSLVCNLSRFWPSIYFNDHCCGPIHKTWLKRVFTNRGNDNDLPHIISLCVFCYLRSSVALDLMYALRVVDEDEEVRVWNMQMKRWRASWVNGMGMGPSLD